MANPSSSGSPPQRSKGDDRSRKGRDRRPAGRPPRPATDSEGVGTSRTGSNAGLVENGARVVAIDQQAKLEADAATGRGGFSEGQTKDLAHSSGGGLSQEDPDHRLRGEDQLSDGQSRVAGGEEE